MDMELKEKFLAGWAKYFPGAELPVAFWYSDEEPGGDYVAPPPGHQCMIGVLARAFRGETLRFDAASFGCQGGRRFCGFPVEPRPGFEYFLSYGIPGKLEGERYKKTPELVKEMFGKVPMVKAPARYLVFRRFDKLAAGDRPDAVVFFSPVEVLSGLFTLANFDEAEPNGVFSPFSAGCGTIVQYPYLEKSAARPRAVLGNFDVSSRPFMPKGALSFAVPMPKFERMVDGMDESFLITKAWERVRARL